MVYLNWTLIQWDGNKSLNYECYRKSFIGGNVSIGINDFLLISFSFGPNSSNSYSSTRWRKDRILSVTEAKELVDFQKKKQT